MTTKSIARAEPMDMATAGSDEQTSVELVDTSMVSALAQSDIEQQLVAAHRYPRSISGFRDKLLTMATLDQATADSCIYSIPRGGKDIEGPSVRFAEMVQAAWGNLRCGTQILTVNESYVVVRGFAHDTENNCAVAIDVRRRVTARKGRRVDEDAMQLAVAAASAIARRNAILAVVPRALSQEAYEAADRCASTGQGSAEQQRDAAIAAFVRLGATEDDVFAALGVEGRSDITGQHIRRLRRWYTSAKDGTATLQELLRPASDVAAESRGRASSVPIDVPQRMQTTQVAPDYDPTDKDAP